MHGDSKLIISFLQKTARPGKTELVQAMQDVRAVVGRWQGRRVNYKHIPRELNHQADWLSKVGLALGRNLFGVEKQFPGLREGAAPPTSLGPLEQGEPLPQAACWEIAVGDR